MSREAVEREAWWNPTREVSDLALEMIAAGIVYDTENISSACNLPWKRTTGHGAAKDSEGDIAWNSGVWECACESELSMAITTALWDAFALLPFWQHQHRYSSGKKLRDVTEEYVAISCDLCHTLRAHPP